MKLLLTMLFIFSFFFLLYSQENRKANKDNPNLSLYLDCQTCDLSYISENLSQASMVTEKAVADVHIMITELAIGGGATRVNIVLSGQKIFGAIRDTISFNLPPDISPDNKRNLHLEKINLGLVPFLMKTPAASRLYLIVSEDGEVEEIKEKDPWKAWVFGLNGMGSIMNQKSYKSYNLNLELNGSKITENFKLESYNRLDYNESQSSYYDFDSSLYQFNFYKRGFFSNNLAVKSLGDHFGIGGIVLVKNDHLNNMSMRMQIGPAIEYNVFSYKKAMQKQFRFLYSPRYELTNYVDTTIFNKTTDRGWSQSLSVMARYYDLWGYLDASIQCSNYLNDFSKYSVGGSIMANIKLYKKLSISVQSSLAMRRDRINQAKGYATLGELISQRREMETDYYFNFSFGIEYRFGSKKFPGANPRFSYF